MPNFCLALELDARYRADNASPCAGDEMIAVETDRKRKPVHQLKLITLVNN